MDSLLPLLVFLLISGAAAWLKRRQHTDEPTSSPASPPTAPRPMPGAPPAEPPRRAPTSSWEEELRRLLEGETPDPSPARPQPPPIQPQRLPPAPRSVPPPLPRPVLIKPLPTPPPPLPAKRASRPPKNVAGSPVDESAEARSARLATMAEATAAFQRASHLHDGVTRHLEQIDEQTEHHLVKPLASRRRSVPSDAALAVSLTRSPRSARQAVVAAIILGPPKALER